MKHLFKVIATALQSFVLQHSGMARVECSLQNMKK
ncbi:hypothetical protein QZH41_009625 [Actinostola sp. cb2023]|nr:hypothetical protein QZH41_009625 [Actinostola sp. cb2023]